MLVNVCLSSWCNVVPQVFSQFLLGWLSIIVSNNHAKGSVSKNGNNLSISFIQIWQNVNLFHWNLAKFMSLFQSVISYVIQGSDYVQSYGMFTLMSSFTLGIYGFLWEFNVFFTQFGRIY